MARKNPDKFRRERAKELHTLAQILVEYGGLGDSSALMKAAEMCRKSTPRGPDSYGYFLEQLRFKIKTPRHTLPSDIGDYLDLYLSVSLKGVCELGSDDPFKDDLSVNIEISGGNSSQHKNICAWHLDRHILGEEDNEPDEVHPLYHFQYGGKNMRYLENIGEVLLLEPPRLAYPPMDAVLAIDFVLSNYMGSLWKKLKVDSRYRSIIACAQKNFWFPYFKSIVAKWGSTPERQAHNTLLLWPNLVDFD